jgi:hypothetical protein
VGCALGHSGAPLDGEAHTHAPSGKNAYSEYQYPYSEYQYPYSDNPRHCACAFVFDGAALALSWHGGIYSSARDLRAAAHALLRFFHRSGRARWPQVRRGGS